MNKSRKIWGECDDKCQAGDYNDMLSQAHKLAISYNTGHRTPSQRKTGSKVDNLEKRKDFKMLI